MKTFSDYKMIDNVILADGKVIYRAVESDGGSFGIEVYSDLFSPDGFNAVYDVTDSSELIKRMLFDFADGFVEPADLCQTVEDYLSNCGE